MSRLVGAAVNHPAPTLILALAAGAAIGVAVQAVLDMRIDIGRLTSD
jgi:hypothetical protein